MGFSKRLLVLIAGWILATNPHQVEASAKSGNPPVLHEETGEISSKNIYDEQKYEIVCKYKTAPMISWRIGYENSATCSAIVSCLDQEGSDRWVGIPISLKCGDKPCEARDIPVSCSVKTTIKGEAGCPSASECLALAKRNGYRAAWMPERQFSEGETKFDLWSEKQKKELRNCGASTQTHGRPTVDELIFGAGTYDRFKAKLKQVAISGSEAIKGTQGLGN